MSGYKAKPTAERLFSWVTKTDTCWLWIGRRNNNGYGLIGMRVTSMKWRTDLAHRVSWSIVNGPIPAKMCILHRCDTPLCVRPDHLFLGTQQENLADMRLKGRARYGVSLGESHPRAKLKETDVIIIRQRASAGESGASIARSFNMDQYTIRDVINRSHWKHVP